MPSTRAFIAVGVGLLVAGLSLGLFIVIVVIPTNVVCVGCPDSMSVTFQIIAIHEDNSSIHFYGKITNEGTHSDTGMRILANGTSFGGNWTTSFSPEFPSPGSPLAQDTSVTFSAFLPSGVPHGGWPIACQSFTCAAGDKLYIEVEVYDGQEGVATSGQLIPIQSQ